MNNSLKIVGKLTVLKVLGAALGLFYSILQVRYYGATSATDAYFVAMSASYLISSLVQSGQLAEVFLPEYLIRKHELGQDEASMVLSALINRAVIIIGCVLFVFIFIAPYVIKLMGPGLDPAYYQTAVDILRASSLVVILNVIGAFINTTLNAEQAFGRAEIAGVINALVSILVITTCYNALGIWALLVALIIGKTIEFTIGIYMLKRVGFRYTLNWIVPNYSFTPFIRVMFSTSGYVGATQLYNIVLTSASSFLPEGSFALFNYVLQISNKVKSIVLTPVSTVFFSKFSSAVAEGQQKQTKRIATPIVGLIVFAGLQVSYIILIGDNLLRVLWESRTMTLSDFRLAYIMLCFNFVGALTASVNMILRKSTVAYGFADKLYRWWIIAQLLSAAYTYLAINYLDIYGLATVIMVNTFLILMTTYYVATKYCIDLKEFITSILDKKAYVYFTLMSIFTALVFRLSGLLDSNSIYWEIFSRAVSFTLFIGIAFGLFFRKERGVLFDKINMVIQGKSLRP